MPLSEGNIPFKQQLASTLKSFFSEDENTSNPYYVNPYDDNGDLKSEESIRQESAEKLNQFSNDVAGLIYDFVKSGTIPPGITVQVNTASGTGQTISDGRII